MDVSMEKDLTNLDNLLKRIAVEEDYKNARIDVQAIPSGVANVSSELYLCTISAPSKEDLKLFAKVACIGEDFRNSEDSGAFGFKTELFFYSKLALVFDQFYNKHGIHENDRLYIPRFYGHEFKGCRETMVLENLAIKGFEGFDSMKTFDWDYASAAITQLAKFHALGILCKLDTLKLEGLEGVKTAEFFANENNIKVFKGIALNMGSFLKEEHKEKIKNYFESNGFDNDMKLFSKITDHSYYIHGEYRPANLLHRNLNGKLEVVPVDYQTCRLGSIVLDLMYFIWTGSDSQFRLTHYQEAIEHYYSELTQSLKSLHVDIKEVYPRKVYEEELGQHKTFGLLVGLTMIPTILVEPDDAPKLNSLQDLMIHPNNLAIHRVNEIVSNYIKWGVI